MKILMVAPTPFFSDRGCHVRIYEEAVALRKLGHEVRIVTYHIGRTPKGVVVSRIPSLLFWYKKKEAGPSWWKILLDAMLFVKAAKLLRKTNFDVVHAHLHEGAFLGLMLKAGRFTMAPVVFDYQGSFADEVFDHGFLKRTKYSLFVASRFEGWIERKVDRVVCNSEVSRNRLISREVNSKKVVVVGDGIGWGTGIVASNKYSMLEGQIRAKEASQQVVVYLGLLSKYQGVDLLLRSAKQVLQVNKNVTFVIMGYPNVSEYEQKAESLGVEKQIIFTGKIPYEEIYGYLALGDIAVSPKMSKTEANGKLYNYVFADLPVVLFESEINREILGDLGVYAKYGDGGDYAEKIVWALENKKKLRSSLLKKKRGFVKHNSWMESARILDKLYLEVVKNED